MPRIASMIPKTPMHMIQNTVVTISALTLVDGAAIEKKDWSANDPP